MGYHAINKLATLARCGASEVHGGVQTSGLELQKAKEKRLLYPALLPDSRFRVKSMINS